MARFLANLLRFRRALAVSRHALSTCTRCLMTHRVSVMTHRVSATPLTPPPVLALTSQPCAACCRMQACCSRRPPHPLACMDCSSPATYREYQHGLNEDDSVAATVTRWFPRHPRAQVCALTQPGDVHRYGRVETAAGKARSLFYWLIRADKSTPTKATIDMPAGDDASPLIICKL